MAVFFPKYTLNKIFIFILLIIININIFAENTDIKLYDTVNLRKGFFKEDNWDLYKNNTPQYDVNKKTAFILNNNDDNYNIRFFVAKDGLKDFYSFGRIDYQFNHKKKLEKVKVYFQRNNNSYMYFDRKNEGKYDVYLFGKLYRRSLSYYFSFDSLKILSLYKILSLLENADLDRELLITGNDKVPKIEFINKTIVPATGRKYVNDGARNENGDFVYISNGEKQKIDEQGYNCSGYVKEVMDNYIRLYNPDFKYLDINNLKKERKDVRDNLTFQYKEIDYDILFGIEWVKNIADEVNKICNLNIIKVEELKNDKYAAYFNKRGYEIKWLKEIIFRDQQKDSNYFYILVFNKLRNERPVVAEYYHLAVAVPYFFDNHFYIRVFESGKETDFDVLRKNHNDKVVIFKVPIPVEYFY